MQVRNEFFAEQEAVVLGFSGGADSSALFHMLVHSGLNLKITAVHVNHGLRGKESDEDELFCAGIARRYGALYRAFAVDISKYSRERGVTVEEGGRKYRYNAFADTAKEFGAAKIITAHNKDDNAETVLMRFFRGTGLAGLAGIPSVRGNIVRPLLHTSREEIIAYLRENNIPYRKDLTNDSNSYTRNKIRNIILPVLREEFNPRITDSVAAAAEILGAENEFLNSIAKEWLLKSMVSNDGSSVVLCMNKLKQADEVISRRVIRLAYEMLTQHMKDLSNAHVISVLKLLQLERGKEISLPGGVTARAGHEALILDTRGNVEITGFCYETDLETDLFISEKNALITFNDTDMEANTSKQCKKLYTIRQHYGRINKGLVFRTRRPGDFVSIKGVGRKKLKALLNGLKLSGHEKTELFYLAEGSRILAVLGNDALTKSFGELEIYQSKEKG